MSKFKLQILFFSVLFISHNLNSQINNTVFNQNDSFNLNDTNKILMRYEAIQFFRNTEYFDIIEDGLTYFGHMSQLDFTFYVNKRVKVRAGTLLRHDFGSPKLFFSPLFQIEIKRHQWKHVFGQLYGTTNLGLIEPMFNIDNALTNRIENGIQSIYNSEKTYFNNWVSWNEIIYRNDTNQEQFNTGFVLDKRIFKKKQTKILIPLQGTLVHRGGQINVTPKPIYTRINISTGLKLHQGLNKNTMLKMESYALYSNDFSPTISQPYNDGYAFWNSISLKVKSFETYVQYWHGREYQSPIGTQIFNNYNIYDVVKKRQLRDMLMLRMMYQKQIFKNMYLDLRLEPLYDFQYKFVQYSYSCYLKMNLDRRIARR